MTPSAEDLLTGVFGYRAFRPGQQEVVRTLATGHDCLAVMPTGAGKSLCYQIPALMFDRPTVVVSPLLALIDDQVEGLKSYGVPAARIHSGMTRDDQVAEWRQVQSGATKILYLSPERLMTDRMLAALAALDAAMFVVDEAHCMSKWGSSFRPDYEQLARLPKLFPRAVMAAFTATADRATRDDIAAKLFRGQGRIIVQGFDRPNLFLGVADKIDWREQLLEFLKDKAGQSGLVYCLSRKFTEEVAAFLAKRGFAALPYHAGQESGIRKASQDRFMSEDGLIMVATIAFGMGIDKPDIRFVAHLNLPGSMEAFYQEIGRAGRDGERAETLLLHSLEDMGQRRRFISDGGGDDAHKIREHKRLDALLAYCETASCRRTALLSYFEEASSPCGHCDNCVNPPQTEDASKHARVALSAVGRTGQVFGAAHIVDVIRGADTAKVRQFRHDALPMYGAGKGIAKPYWLSLIRQAVAGGYLTLDIQKFGGISLTGRGHELVQGHGTFTLRRVAEQPLAKTRPAAAAAQDGQEPVASDLLKRLKSLRLELARARGVPAYVIFHDATLIEMARVRPASLDQLAAIGGVGPRKLEQYGDAVISVLADRTYS